jgi:hypothetical protein
MNTLTILQNALLPDAEGKPRISQIRAVRYANKRLGGTWAVAQDTKRLDETNSLISDLHGQFYETDVLLIPVRVSANQRASNAWVSRLKYKRGLLKNVYKCQLTQELCHADYIARLNVINEYDNTIVVAGSYCERMGYIFMWRDGTYHTIREPAARQVLDYHSQSVRPRWWKEAKGIGMELEINCNDRDKLVTKLHNDIMAERDGSLDRSKGVELIGGPYSCEDYQKGATPWEHTLTEVKNIGGAGHYAEGGSGFYGIHLSLSRSLFTTFHGAKFVVFFNQQKELCQLIGQRTQLYGVGEDSGYGKRKKVKDVVCYNDGLYQQSTIRSHLKNDLNRKITSKNTFFYSETTKYEPVRVDDKRYEVRIFRANLRWERILKNVEFVDAVKEYTREASAATVATPYEGTADFLYWLGKRAGYTYLKKFLVDNASSFNDGKNHEDFKKRVDFKLNKTLATTADL